MKLLKHACASYNANTKNKRAFPAKPPSVIDSQICSKFMGCYIIKTPLWVIQHCLSQVKGVGKTYLVHISDARELAAAADGAFVICGLLNPNCAERSDNGNTPEYPYDPACSFVSPKSQQHKIPSVVLYFPSTGMYYSPWYIADTSHLQAKGLCLLDKILATSIVLQMLPATSLQIRQDSTLPGDGGHLKVFTDIYQIDVESPVSQILTLLPVLHGLHVNDSEICIPHDVAIGHYGFIYQTERTPEHNYVLLQNNFIQEWLESDSNKAGCN